MRTGVGARIVRAAVRRLLRAYASGEYRHIPARSLVLIVAWVFNTLRTVLDDFGSSEAARGCSAAGQP
jgi:hypothetical protein